MRDERLARLPVWVPLLETFSALVFATQFVTESKGSALPWLALALSFLMIVSAARTAQMEVRLLASNLRVVNLWRTVDIPLHDIEGLMPDRSLPGPLTIRVRDRERPVSINISARSGKRREELRRTIQTALRGATRV